MLMKELVAAQGNCNNNKTYELMNGTNEGDIKNDYKRLKKRCRLCVNEKNCLPQIFNSHFYCWLPKLHENSTIARFKKAVNKCF